MESFFVLPNVPTKEKRYASSVKDEALPRKRKKLPCSIAAPMAGDFKEPCGHPLDVVRSSAVSNMRQDTEGAFASGGDVLLEELRRDKEAREQEEAGADDDGIGGT